MRQLQLIFGLKREAILLDSRLFIIKAMVAISIGYILGQAFSITRLDMISVLLGVMYNLEAINVSGIRGGINQLLASTLGALTTGLLVVLMGYEISFLTVALGIGFTIYIALKIDYRMVSPVAIFTSIYMTQLIQNDGLGNPSILLTFRLRILALGLGVAVALLCNFLFSILYYRKLGKRRLDFVKIQGVKGLEKTLSVLKQDKIDDISYQPILAGVFSDIEMVKANLDTMRHEHHIPFNITEKKNLVVYTDMIIQIKTMIHLAYDSIYIKENTEIQLDPNQLEILETVIQGLKELDFTDLKNTKVKEIQMIDPLLYTQQHHRIIDNLNLMGTHYKKLIAQIAQLNKTSS
ncbi:MAG: hypothetical protein FD133_1549 [Erysipelotrichaceae bacterium]|nr:MAG: hypothetical protein FD179_1702 [Erysipelotrichaceae bacterium]TXT17077.1 MAG: hypothetical protein FD133_1549 [Erysipelotrichaceae bacterium]